MANISTARQADLLYKVLKGKSQTNLNSPTYEENYTTFPRVLSKQVWIQSSEIPSTAPTLSDKGLSGVVSYHENVELFKVDGSGGYSWIDPMGTLKDMIDYERFGNSYIHTLTADGSPITPSIGNNVVDGDAGIVTFDRLPGVTVYNTLTITFYKYIGRKGNVLDLFGADGKYKVNGQVESLFNSGLDSGIISDIGVKWSPSVFNTNSGFCSFSKACYLGNGVVVVSTYNGTNVSIFRSIDSGKNFNYICKLYESDLTGEYNLLGRAMVCTTNSVLLCGTYQFSNDTNGKIFRSINGGLTWGEVTLPPFTDCSFILDIGGGVVVAAIRRETTSTSTILYSSDDGGTWSNQGIDMFGVGVVAYMAYAGGSSLLVCVGNKLLSVDIELLSGGTLSSTELYNFGVGVSSVNYCGGGICVVGLTNGSVYRSSGGDYTKFNLIATSSGIFSTSGVYIYSLKYAGNGIIIACGGGVTPNTHVSISKDMGLTWRNVYTRSDDYCLDSLYVDGDILVFGGNKPDILITPAPYIARSSVKRVERSYRYDDIIEVDLAATTALPACAYSSNYKKITANANGELTLDGISVSNSHKLLINGQTDKKQNGVYVVLSPGSPSSKFVLLRADEFVDALDFSKRDVMNHGKRFIVMVGNGTANANTAWFIKNVGGVVPTIDDVTSGDIEFVQVGSGSGSGSGSGGSGSGVYWVDTIANLQALTTHNNGDTSFVYDYNTGQVASYAYDSSSAVADDSSSTKTTIKPTDVTGDGRWLRKEIFSSSDHTHAYSPIDHTHAYSPIGHIHTYLPSDHSYSLSDILANGTAASNKITALDPGTNATDAVNKNQMETYADRYKSNGTTGEIQYASGTNNGFSSSSSLKYTSSRLGVVSSGTADPKSTLDVNGSVGMGVSVKSDNANLDLSSDNSHHTIIFNNATSDITVTLPTASGVARREYRFFNTGSKYVTISGLSNYVLCPGHTIDVISDGTSWYKTSTTNISDSITTVTLTTGSPPLDLNYYTTKVSIDSTYVATSITPSYSGTVPDYGERVMIITNNNAANKTISLPSNRYSPTKNYYYTVESIILQPGYTAELHYAFFSDSIRIVMQEFFYNKTA